MTGDTGETEVGRPRGRGRSSSANQRPVAVQSDQCEACVCPCFREQDAGADAMGLRLTLEPGLWTPATRLAMLSLASGSRVGLAWPGLGAALLTSHHPPSPSVSLCQVSPVSPWWPVTRLTGHQAHHGIA